MDTTDGTSSIVGEHCPSVCGRLSTVHIPVSYHHLLLFEAIYFKKFYQQWYQFSTSSESMENLKIQIRRYLAATDDRESGELGSDCVPCVRVFVNRPMVGWSLVVVHKSKPVERKQHTDPPKGRVTRRHSLTLKHNKCNFINLRYTKANTLNYSKINKSDLTSR